MLLIWSILNLDWHISSQTPVLFGFTYLENMTQKTFLHPGQYRQNTSNNHTIKQKKEDTVDGRNLANQLRLVVFPIIYRVSYIPGGAGFLPSQEIKRYSEFVIVPFRHITWSFRTSFLWNYYSYHTSLLQFQEQKPWKKTFLVFLLGGWVIFFRIFRDILLQQKHILRDIWHLWRNTTGCSHLLGGSSQLVSG